MRSWARLPGLGATRRGGVARAAGRGAVGYRRDALQANAQRCKAVLFVLTRGSRFETFPVLPPPGYAPTPVRFSHEGLESLRLGLAAAGLTSFDTASFPWPSPGFEHEADGTTPRRPYRGLKPIDVPDAGVFFGRDADLVRARDHLADGRRGRARDSEAAARAAEARSLDRQRTMQRRVGVLLKAVAIITFVGGWLVVASRRDLARQTSQLIAANAQKAFEAGQYDRAMRLALVASQGTWLASPSVDAEIQLGRAAHFSRLEAQLTGHKRGVTTAAFSPDGTRIVTASDDNTARVWSRGEDGAWHSVALEGPKFGLWLRSASFSSDGARIVTASVGSARVWSKAKDGAWSSVDLEGHEIHVTSVAFSPDNARIVTTSWDRTARVWSLGEDGAWWTYGGTLEGHEDRVNAASLEGHQGAVTSAAFSPDGTRIVTASKDGTARIWNVRWLMGPSERAEPEPLTPPEVVCQAKLQGSWGDVRNPRTGGLEGRIVEPVLTAADIQAAPILNGREGEDVCAPFLEPRPWWSRLAFWR